MARQRIVAALSDQSFRVSLSAQPPAMQAVDDDDAPAAQSDQGISRRSAVARHRRGSRACRHRRPDGPPFGPWHPMMGHGPMMHGFGGFARLPRSAGRDPAGGWPVAVVRDRAARRRPCVFALSSCSRWAIMAIIILAVSVWAVRRVTAPLASLAAAAERLGNDVNAPPLPETGTIETRQASRAFNDMQARLRSLIENRTRMLAAISHDLRTPLTLLRLRAENVENAQERDKMLATIAEMDAMIGATLQFARDESASEPRRPTDLTALAAKHRRRHGRRRACRFAWSRQQPIVYECRPAALKRAVRNLLDNAVKYGKTGSVADPHDAEGDRDHIDDEGPGIPEQELVARVRAVLSCRGIAKPRDRRGRPRAWRSRSRSCRRTAATLTLSNRPTGGLRANNRASSLSTPGHGDRALTHINEKDGLRSMKGGEA